MPAEIDPRGLQEQVIRGYERTQNFRAARLMHLRQFAGPYYDRSHGPIGTEPLNLMFNAIRSIVPNIVMTHPKFHVESRFVAYREYAKLMGMALDYDAVKKDLRTLLRACTIDALFAVGILKTGICDSGSLLSFKDWDQKIDPGAVYTARVDFDDFIIDPAATSLETAGFLGDRIRVPRAALLDSGLYDNAMIERLPTADSDHMARDRAQNLSQKEINLQEVSDFMDDVEVVELYVPSAKSIVTIPWGKTVLFDDYLRVHDHYGPATPTGPYSCLQLGLPVANNPFHAAPVGIWHDLHVLANKMAKKVIDQALRQKTILGYRRTAADDAQEALDAGDGEAVAMDDPEGMQEFNFGGQQATNEAMTGQLQMWFNMMAANPQGISGQGLDAGSATEAQILQGNASVGLNDMKDMVYILAGSEGSKRAWYFHTDPLIEIPLIKRTQTPVMTDPMTGMMMPPAMQEQQVFLTPEARRGDWLDFTFTVQPESMGRVDSAVRLRQALDFAVKVMPAAVQTAQGFAMLGIPFNVSKYILRMAEEVGITWMDEVFFDPEFQMMMAQIMMRGPQPDGSKGMLMPPGGGMLGMTGPGGMGAIMQNGQPANVGATNSPDTEARQGQQANAAEGQRNLPNRQAY